MRNDKIQIDANLVTKEAMKVLENNLARMRDVNYIPNPKPKKIKWELTKIKWRIQDYFSNLWDALCGRNNDYY